MGIQILRKKVVSQPFVSLGAVSLATLTLVFAWSRPAAGSAPGTQTLLLAVLLLLAVPLAGRFPIHVRNNVKLMMLTVPLYLMAVLLPPPLAALTAGLGMLWFALDARSRMGLVPADIATLVGRWIVGVYLTAVVAHSAAALPGWHLFALTAAAGVMYLCDVVGVGFKVTSMTGESSVQVMRSVARSMALPEGVQYGLGILGALVATSSVFAPVLLVVPIGIVYVLFKRYTELQQNTRLVLEQMSDAVEQRDPYTGGHSRRVAEISRSLLDELGISGVEAELIVTGARVHDLGKISIPDEILCKRVPLSPDELQIMQAHAAIGASLLQAHPNFRRGVAIVRHHHERWDGMGYPDKLKGMEIPLGARVIAVADSFDAMTSDRPYRRAFSVEQAHNILRQGRGTRWDPRIVNALLTVHKVTKEARLEQPEVQQPVQGVRAVV